MSLLDETLIYEMEIGVISGGSKKDKKKEKHKGVTNAELMAILEKGSPLRNLPPRPVIQLTIDHVNENMLDEITDRALEAYITDGQKALEDSLNKDCLRVQEYAQDIIYDSDTNGLLEPNAPSTIKRKGFNHPLFVTGELARSITCVLVNEKGEKV